MKRTYHIETQGVLKKSIFRKRDLYILSILMLNFDSTLTVELLLK